MRRKKRREVKFLQRLMVTELVIIALFNLFVSLYRTTVVGIEIMGLCIFTVALSEK